MIDRLRQALLGITVHAEQRSIMKNVRRLFIGGAAVARNPRAFAKGLEGLADTMQRHEAETATWVAPKAIAAGEGGAFDVLDLRHWLALAERAGVAYIPARELLTLSEDELGLLSGTIKIPDTAGTRRLFTALQATAGDDALTPPPTPHINREALSDRLFDAMDDVPEGWMVRSNRCGSSELKTLAGVGVVGATAPEVRFGPNLEVGPGWVRQGNRRRIHVSDKRTIDVAASGPGFLVFLARPWVESSRYITARDPHLEATPFAHEGRWPAEWRVFVQNGIVTGVASYYGWADHASPDNARTALEARRLAQKIVDEALAQHAWPRFIDLELVRNADWIQSNPELANHVNVELGRETVSCTLDFIETANGLMLLEGGPPSTPIGGGHPCAFAGAGGPPTIGKVFTNRGVAFRVMEGILLADFDTWNGGDPTGVHFTWDEVESLAAEACAA